MSAANNPAGQLLQILKQLLDQSDEFTMIQAWAATLGCKTMESGFIVIGIQKIIRLNSEARDAAKSFAPGDPSIYIAPFDKVERFLHNHNLSNRLSSYRQFLDVATMTSLAFVDHLLSQEYSAEHPGAIKNVREFINALDELLEECLNSSLSPSLKTLFTQHLEALRKALLEYRLGNESKLNAAIDQFTGSMIRNRESIGAEFDKIEGILDKSVCIMASIEQLVIKSKSIATLAAPAAVHLLSWFK